MNVYCVWWCVLVCGCVWWGCVVVGVGWGVCVCVKGGEGAVWEECRLWVCS